MPSTTGLMGVSCGGGGGGGGGYILSSSPELNVNLDVSVP